MPLLFIALIAGVLLARFRPPVEEPQLTKRALWLCPPLIFAAGVQSLAIRHAPENWQPRLVIITTVIAMLWTLGTVLVFRGSGLRIGVAVFTFGAALNLIPIAQRGYMPVDREAAVSVGLPPVDDVGRGHPAKHRLVDPEEVPLLGDHIAIRPLFMVASIGDLVQMVGLVFVTRAVWPRSRRLQRQPQPAS